MKVNSQLNSKIFTGSLRISRLIALVLFIILILFITSCSTNVVSSSNNSSKAVTLNTVKNNNTLQTASFINLNTGWIVLGHSILSTKDGGLHWNEVSSIKSDAHDIDFLTENIGWLSSNDGLLRTDDGGKTWNQATNLKDLTVTRVQFVNPNAGWIYGYNGPDKDGNSNYYFLRTINSGKNWTSIKTPEPNIFGSLAFFFTSPKQGWLIIGSQPGAGSQGKIIYKTLDGGESWNKIASASIPPNKSDGLPIGGYVSDIYFLNENQGWFTESRGQIYATTDGGNTWEMVDKHPIKEWFMFKPFFENNEDGYVLSADSGKLSLLGTKDGGHSWKVIYPLENRK
jgi:photosystem II stability/assembly factor-like uncharacterized protein